MPIKGKISERTLYDSIRSTLSHAVSVGDIEPGEKLPTESDLAIFFGTSRPTINKALRSLARDGLVETRKRGGTVVVEQKGFTINMMDISEQVLVEGKSYRFEVIERSITINGESSFHWRSIGDGTPVLNLECIHYSGDLPIQHERRIINLESLPEAENANFSTTSPGAWLKTKSPWPLANHTIGAVGAGNVLAKSLHVRRGTPCIGILQILKSSGSFIAMAELTSPAGRFYIKSMHQ